MTHRLHSVVVPPNACALRLVRTLKSGKLRVFEAITFPKDPYAGCENLYRRAKDFGHIAKTDGETYGLSDVLDKDGDIISDFWLTRRGFDHLKRKLGCHVEP